MTKVKFTIFLLVLFFLMAGKSNFAFAAPHFTFTPTSGSYNNGSSFSVTLGIESETQQVGGVDLVGTFDASKLQITSIDKVSSPAFSFEYNSSSTPIIHNDTGKFEITLNPTSSSVYDYKPASGPLLTINFSTKATGTANVGLTCQSGSVADTNIINQQAADVVDCASNQSGSYTINDGGNNPSSPTSTPAPSTSTTSTQLPKTGGTAQTIGLVIFGAVSVMGALFLRFL
jgi:LPXTG-motif cell wall-anchored protein